VTVHGAAVVDTSIIAAFKLYDPSQHVEATFDPLPYDQGAARLYGQIRAAVRAAEREPRKRTSDLMTAATAASNQLPLYTANPDDFKDAEGLVEIVGIQARPNNL
jgi:predicted nucleic acid-binding protein